MVLLISSPSFKHETHYRPWYHSPCHAASRRRDAAAVALSPGATVIVTDTPAMSKAGRDFAVLAN